MDHRICKICEKELTRKQKSFCCKQCYNISKIGRKHSIESLRKMRGRKLSAETIRKQNEAKRKEKIIKFGHFTCDKCKKLFTTNTSLRAHRSYCNDLSHDESPSKCNECDISFKTHRGLKIHISLCHTSFCVREERRAKMRAAKFRSTARTESSAELVFFEEIKSIFIDAVRNFVIDGYSHVYDIYIPSQNLILEFDGDFWHGNKKMYELSPRMKKQYNLDIIHSQFANKRGFTLQRIWQSESSEFLSCLKEKYLV